MMALRLVLKPDVCCANTALIQTTFIAPLLVILTQFLQKLLVLLTTVDTKSIINFGTINKMGKQKTFAAHQY